MFTLSHLRRRARLVPLVCTLALAVLAPGCANDDDEAAQEPATGERPVAVTGGSSSLSLDGTVDGVLSVAGASVSAAGGAEERDGAYAFPIRDGELGSSSVAGSVAHDGGLELSASGRTTVVRDLVVDLDGRVVNGRVGDRELPVLALDPDSGEVRREGDRLTVSALQASLTKEAADLVQERSGLDGPLGGQVVDEGQDVGEITIEGRTG